MAKKVSSPNDDVQKGSALVIALLVMILLMGFVALAVSRTTSETMITSNDSSEARAYAATEASVESATRDFVDIFERKLSPDTNDIQKIQSKTVSGFDNFGFKLEIKKARDSAPFVLTGGNYSGLYALRDSWQIDAEGTEKGSGVNVKLNRRFFSDKIPIYQFGIFFEDDLELNRPPLFTFGGRVHTNGSLFVTGNATSGIYFNSKVSAAGEIINDVWKPGTTLADGTDNRGKVFINDAAGTRQELKTGEGSVNCASVGKGILTPAILATCQKNTNWSTQKTKFQGNLENNVAKLNLPLTKLGIDLVELVRRGKDVGDMHNLNGSVVAVTATTKDSEIISKERFANKTGIRIALADSKQKLPGCAAASASTNCGVRLDDKLGTSSYGYQPLTMLDGYKATALNATRMAMNNRQIWIKIETVGFNENDSSIKTDEITQEVLSLGVTEAAPSGLIDGYLLNPAKISESFIDSRSVIKLQRFTMPGGAIPFSGTKYIDNKSINGVSQNLVIRYSNVNSNPSSSCTGCTVENAFAAPLPTSESLYGASQEDAYHLKWATIGGLKKYAIVPFPIQLFDSREGLPNDNATEANTNFGTDRVPSSGVMSLVDIDVANLRRFLNGDFDGQLPGGTYFSSKYGRNLKSTDIPQADGWVVYFSDRRGDYDFDGAYDMEDIFPNNLLEFNEDLNKNGKLDTDFGREAPTYTTAVARGQAATADHLYYRRGVRLINGSTLPGTYDKSNPANTKGFTFASENGVYVSGNYNVGSISGNTGTSVTPPENYSPQNQSGHVPASIVGDAVIILSNSWNDSQSFVYPFSSGNRVASNTQVRFAMLAGDAITGDKSFYSPSQFGQINGGVHNFKRFLESWSDKRLNYSGSLINLFNSNNNNGFMKCCNTVYSPPIRDWTFEPSFLDIDRLPPGTPFIYSISFTGFQRVND